MIEELKLVLDSLGDVSGMAAWVVGAFVAYKLIVYLSTTGAFVYVLVLGINKLYDAATKPRKVSLYGQCIDGITHQRLVKAIEGCMFRTGVYLHPEDVDEIANALKVLAEEKRGK